jgi:hypothetical protein
LRPSLTSVSTPSWLSGFSQLQSSVSMVRCKNVSGGPSDGDESPPRVTEVARGKHKKLAVKKRKRTPTEVEIA